MKTKQKSEERTVTYYPEAVEVKVKMENTMNGRRL